MINIDRNIPIVIDMANMPKSKEIEEVVEIISRLTFQDYVKLGISFEPTDEELIDMLEAGLLKDR